MPKMSKKSFFNRSETSDASLRRSSIGQALIQSAMDTEIVSKPIAVFPTASDSWAPYIDDDDNSNSVVPKPMTPKRQKAAMLLNDSYESPVQQKLTSSRLQFDINEESPQRPVKKSSSSFLQSFGSSSISLSTKQRRSRHLNFLKNRKFLPSVSRFTSTSSPTPTRNQTYKSTPTSHASFLKTQMFALTTPTFNSWALNTPKCPREMPMTPQKTGSVLTTESPLMASAVSPELYKSDNSDQLEDIAQHSQNSDRPTSMQRSEELDFDIVNTSLSSKASTEFLFNSAEIGLTNDPYCLSSVVDNSDCRQPHKLEDLNKSNHKNNAGSRINDIGFKIQYDSRPLPLNIKGHHNVFALSQLAVNLNGDDILHNKYRDVNGTANPKWDCVDNESDRVFITTKRSELLQEFDSQINNQTCNPITMPIEDTFNAVSETTTAVFFKDASSINEVDAKITGINMLDALEDCPASTNFESEPIGEDVKDKSDPLEDDEKLDKEEAKLSTESFAIRSTDIVDGFRYVQLIGGPTIICNASRFFNIAQELLVTKDTGFLMIFNGEEYLVGPRLAQ